MTTFDNRTIHIDDEEQVTQPQSLGKRIVKWLSWPFSLGAAIVVAMFRGDGKIIFAGIGLLIALLLNLNSYWMGFFGRPSLAPIPILYEQSVKISLWPQLIFYAEFWFSLAISGIMTILQSPAVTSEDPETLLENHNYYKSITLPDSKNIDWDKHPVMAKKTADTLKGLDVAEHNGALGLTIISWLIEVFLTYSQLSSLTSWGLRFIGLCYSIVVSLAPELMIGKILSLFRESIRLKHLQQRYKRG